MRRNAQKSRKESEKATVFEVSQSTIEGELLEAEEHYIQRSCKMKYEIKSLHLGTRRWP